MLNGDYVVFKKSLADVDLLKKYAKDVECEEMKGGSFFSTGIEMMAFYKGEREIFSASRVNALSFFSAHTMEQEWEGRDERL